jgi:hypothetical protein
LATAADERDLLLFEVGDHFEVDELVAIAESKPSMGRERASEPGVDMPSNPGSTLEPTLSAVTIWKLALQACSRFLYRSISRRP